MGEAPGWELTRVRLAWLTGALALVLAPHVGRVPYWVSASFVLLALWRLASLTRGVRAPGRWLFLALQAGLLAGIYLHYRTLFGRDPGVALLSALAGLKLLETRTQRDAFICVLLGYFLVITNFLYSQTIPTGLYMLAVVVVMTTTLITLNVQPAGLPARARLRLAASMLAQALPVALALFLLFPRVQGPFWGLPDDAHSAVSGLSDELTLGAISRLGLSDAVAFRVLFDGPPPAGRLSYWRGPVLWDSDGVRWVPGRFGRDLPPPKAEVEDRLDYTVTLEPHNRRWLFLLDIPTRLPRGSRLTHDLVALSNRPVRERRRYRATSGTAYRVPEISERERRHGLALPRGRHPRARALAAEWRTRLGNRPERIVAETLRYLRQEGFVYTLRPPRLEGDPIDQFLFETRRGFCEHYATAFVVLMRAAGIPARVVTGYQGGRVNPLDGFLVMRQMDAHAWAEVWLQGRGWKRVDPTSAVSPERIERGMEGAVRATAGALAGVRLDRGGLPYRLWRELGFAWEAANNWWSQWVLGYGPERQEGLLARLGIDIHAWGQVGLALLVLAGGPLLGVAIWLGRRLHRASDPVQRLYRRYCAVLARLGVPRAAGEGPLDYGRRAAARLPARSAEILAISGAYARLRYGPGGGDLASLRRRVRRFRR